MTEYLLLGILVLAFVTIYLHHKITDKGSFDRVVYVYLWITVAHICNTLIWFYCFTEKTYVDWAAPFGLCYGPLFYFGYNAANSILIRRREVFIHSSPFVLFYISYMFFVGYSTFRTEYELLYFLVLYSSNSVSMISYCVWGVLYKGIENSRSVKNRIGQINRFITSVSMIFWVMALLFVACMYNSFVGNIPNGQSSLMYTYSVIAIILFIAFRYTAHRLVENDAGAYRHLDLQNAEGEDIKTRDVSSYQKSAIPEMLFDNYEERLTERMKEYVYLDPELTLDRLASDLKITKHHLTQMLNLGIGKSFNQFINGYRIEHACMLLKDLDFTLTMEELAHECGFNSKSSFNRNFKSQMGCTPSEYRVKSD